MEKKNNISGIFLSNVAKGYGVTDVVYVWFHDKPTLEMIPQSRTVRHVDVTTSGNEAIVEFTTGEKVTDGATARVFTTQALCATAIVSAAITRYGPASLLDATLSGVSTAGQPTTGLIRKS